MVHNGNWHNQNLTLSIKPNCITISLQSTSMNEVYSFDLSGRLWTCMRGDRSYRRGLNGKIVAKWITSSGERERKWLSAAEEHDLLKSSRQFCLNLIQAVTNQELIFIPALTANELGYLKVTVLFDQSDYQKDVERFNNIYKPVGILPPDQYMAVVLQAAEGCSFNTCTFCDFYRSMRFHIKTLDEFNTHLHHVKDYLGAGLSLRRTIFLGDANALVVPMPRLLPMLNTVHQVFDVESLGGIYAFLDGFSGDKKTTSDYHQLSKLGLKRIYLGVESGNNDLLRYLKKPGNSQDAVQAVQSMKGAGIAVGIIILLGAGGKKFAQAHVDDTIDILNKMQLDADDIIYFSELVENAGLSYTRTAFKDELAPLTPDERVKQGERIEAALTFSETGGTPHISRYDIREFVY